MSDKEKTEESADKAAANSNELKLNSLFAFKVGMSTVFDDNGEAVNVTLLKYEPMSVSQIKTKENDGYSALQVAFKPKKKTRTTNSELAHLKKAGFENGAYFKREVRQEVPEGTEVGKKVSVESLVKGDQVQITGISKGHGFAGVMKRFNHKGGPAAHGSGFHRRPGSSGNREFPGRVMAGKKMPGHYGCDTTTTINVSVVDVIPEENVLLVKGPVPGGRNSLIKLTKMRA